MGKQIHQKLFALLCIALLLFSTHVSAKSVEQTEKISLSFKNTEVRTILKSIKQQTDYDLVYNAKEINDKIKVSVNVANADIQRALHAVLDQLNINFSIENRIIVLRKKDFPAASSGRGSYPA